MTQLISADCERSTVTAQQTLEDDLAPHCIERSMTASVNASQAGEEQSFTIHSMAKYRYYRFRVAAVTNAGLGNYTEWIYKRTLAGSRNDNDDMIFVVLPDSQRK